MAADLRRGLALHLLEKAAAHVTGAVDVEVEYDQIDSVVIRLADGGTWIVGISEADDASMDETRDFLTPEDPRAVVVILPISRKELLSRRVEMIPSVRA